MTIFWSGPLLPGTSDLWHRLTGRDPESDEHRRREGLHRQTGPHGEGELEIRVMLNRIDLLMKPLIADMPSLAFGPFETESRAFLALARPWLEDTGGEVVRLAFAGSLLCPASGRSEAYKLLGHYVPSLKVDAEGTKEVLYRVNRPTKSKYGMPLNRLTTWAPISVAMQIVALGMPTISEQHFLRLEFDHNTPAEQTDPIDQSAIAPIFEALLQLAIENASEGECP